MWPILHVNHSIVILECDCNSYLNRRWQMVLVGVSTGRAVRVWGQFFILPNWVGFEETKSVDHPHQWSDWADRVSDWMGWLRSVIGYSQIWTAKKYQPKNQILGKYNLPSWTNSQIAKSNSKYLPNQIHKFPNQNLSKSKRWIKNLLAGVLGYEILRLRLTVWEQWRCEIGWFEAAVWARERVITREGRKWEREGAEAEAEAEKWHRERREAEIVRPVWVRGEIMRSVEAALLGNERERESVRGWDLV